MGHPRIGVAVIVIKDHKVLLGKRKQAHGGPGLHGRTCPAQKFYRWKTC